MIGTSAVEKPELVRALVGRFGGERVAVGLDAKDGRIAVKGWVEDTRLDTLTFARQLEADGVETVIHTDIATDGALTGPNLERQAELAEACGLSVIASGGVSTLADVEALARLAASHPNLSGVIVGRALYEGRVGVGEMIAACG